MKTQFKTRSIIALCLVIGGCTENGTITNLVSIETIQNPSTTSTNDVRNGFYRSGVQVTDASGFVTRISTIDLSVEYQLLRSSTNTFERLSPVVPDEFDLYEYNEDGNLTRHVKDDFEGPVKVEKVYDYDDEGKLIGLTHTDASGREWEESYSYNSAGLLSSRYRDLAEEGSTGGALYWSYEHDELGNMVRMTRDAPSIPGPGDVTEFYYDSVNRLIQSQTDWQSDGTVDYRIDYSYDTNGNVEQIAQYDSTGGLFSTTNYSYTATDEIVFNETLFRLKYYPQ